MDLRVLTFALSMFLAFDLGEGIKCHVCNGHTESECKDPYGAANEDGSLIAPSKFEKDCSDASVQQELGYKLPEDVAAPTMCRKIYQDVRGDVRIIRSCAWEEYTRIGEDESKKDACYKTVMEEYNTYVCTCEGELCNGAKVTQVSALLIAVLPLITFGIFHQ